ncbi:MAG: hypothetical protein JW795_14595 [Chitinivibrionales bacterium]|nr:hypothetical protein [Chitinivibrionales bacterium]
MTIPEKKREQPRKVQSQEVSRIIDYLIESKDPAVVGLRRILKKKQEQSNEFPLQSFDFEDLATNDPKQGRIFSESERKIMELEKRCLQLQNQLKEQKLEQERMCAAARLKGVGQGVQTGKKQGFDEAQKDFDKKVTLVEQKLQTLLSDMERSQQLCIMQTQKDCCAIAIAIAEKIINTELTLNQEIILSVVQKVLTHCADKQRFILRVSPDDLQTVTGKKDLWLGIGQRLEHITIEEDPRIEKGGCIIETAAGVADARFSIQNEEFRQVIMKTWESMTDSTLQA